MWCVLAWPSSPRMCQSVSLLWLYRRLNPKQQVWGAERRKDYMTCPPPRAAHLIDHMRSVGGCERPLCGCGCTSKHAHTHSITKCMQEFSSSRSCHSITGSVCRSSKWLRDEGHLKWFHSLTPQLFEMQSSFNSATMSLKSKLPPVITITGIWIQLHFYHLKYCAKWIWRL